MNRSRHLNYPECSLYEFLFQNAQQYQNSTALNYFNHKITYKQLLEKIDICASALTSIGVKSGDAVSICLPNIPQAVITFYAVNKIGAIANMIHPLSAENELIHYLNVSNSRILIAIDLIHKKLPDILPKTKIQKTILASADEYMPFYLKTAYKLTNRYKISFSDDTISWHSFIKLADKSCNITHRANNNDCAVILYSGGTTGIPKGIMLSNLNFNALAMQSIDACGCLKQGDKVLSVMPIFHGFGLGVCIHTVLNFGGIAIILPKFKASEFHKLLFKYKPNVIAGVPAIFENFIRSNAFNGKDLSYLKCVISGGDSLQSSTKIKLNELLAKCNCKCTVREGYGLTECVTGSCLVPEKCKKHESVGLPYADTFYKILDTQTGEELDFEQTGEIILRGPSVMLGYLNEKEETAKTLKTHPDGHTWLHTGDLGYMDKDGYVYFKQRLKRMIISGGYNIYPQNIENIIASHDAVLTSAVIGVDDEIMGQKVKAFVVLKDENADKEKIKTELFELMQKNIARYAFPREMVFVKALPRTLVGKIAYNELADYKEN